MEVVSTSVFKFQICSHIYVEVQNDEIFSKNHKLPNKTFNVVYFYYVIARIINLSLSNKCKLWSMKVE